ncbi:MAG TPA: TfoX/Sxy family protein [Dehalococcoidia bacterium]|nr:TfoX/Sxy family protein [Dehalococcoidia bacterium]
MAYDEDLAERIRALIGADPRVSERKMFGGIAFMVGGNMCCGIVRDELMVRLGPEGYEDALADPHTRPMDFAGRPAKGMVYVSRAGFASDAGLSSWVERGVLYASSLPVKS